MGDHQGKPSCVGEPAGWEYGVPRCPG
uniref:Uncharacterized protein n=1 Tax=Anguilla anguilla TaxID=7936 RepID=A0A0E9U905_ANGAN